MVQARWRRALVVVVWAALPALSACRTTRASSEVDEAWLARVPEEQMGDVRSAQAEQRRAADEVTRSEVAIRDAERAREVASSEADAAKARREAAETALDAARARGQQQGIQQAQANLQAAEAALAAARAQVQWREQVVDARKAERQLKEREAEVAKSELARAEYRALAQHGDVRVQNLSEAEFDAQVARAQQRAAEARRSVEQEVRQVQQARAQWEQLRNAAQGYGGSGPVSQ